MNNIRLVVSPLTGKPYLARFGKDPQVALEKRPIESELLEVVTKWMLHGSIEGVGATLSYRDTKDGQAYELTVKPVSSSDSPTD